ncbi:MAG: ABC transporter substrate-binding protein [Chloroflexota bacterium]
MLKLRSVFVLALLVAAVMSLSIAPALGQEELPSIRLGVQPWLGYGPWWIAEQQGYFEDHGLDVEVIDFTWDQDMNAALAAGRLDVQAAATNTMITLINQGVDVQAFLVLDASYEADAILVSADIQSVEDLAGRSVAYELGATSDLLLNYALNEAGMSIEDVEPVPMAAADAGLALIAGRVDAAVTYEPYISAALREGENYSVLYTSAERPGLISDVMIARREFLAENPAVIEALALAWNDAVTFLRENPEEGGQIIADAVGSPLEEFQIAFEGVEVYDLAQNAELLFGDFPDTFVAVGEIMMMLNPDEITALPEFEDVFVIDYLEAYLPEAEATEAAE